MFEDKEKNPVTSYGGEENMKSAGAREKDTAAFSQNREGIAKEAPLTQKKENSAFLPKTEGNSVDNVGENMNAGAKVAVPYVKKEDRLKMAQAKAATAAKENAAPADASEKKTDSPIPSKSSKPSQPMPMDDDFLTLDFSSQPLYPAGEHPDDLGGIPADKGAYAPYPYATASIPEQKPADSAETTKPSPAAAPKTERPDAFLDRERDSARMSAGGATAEKLAREEEKNALLSALAEQKKREDEAFLGNQRHDMRMSAGKSAWESDNPDFSKDYLKSLAGKAPEDKTAPEKAEKPEKLKEKKEESGEEYLERLLRENGKDPETKVPEDNALFKKMVLDDGLREDAKSATSSSAAFAEKMNKKLEKHVEKHQAKIKRLGMEKSEFDGGDVPEDLQPKTSDAALPNDTPIEDYLLKRLASMRIDSDRYQRDREDRSAKQKKADKLARKREKSEAIKEAVISLSGLGIEDEKMTKKVKKSIAASQDERFLREPLNEDAYKTRLDYERHRQSLSAKIEKAKLLDRDNTMAEDYQSYQQQQKETASERQEKRAQLLDERHIVKEEKKVNPEVYYKEYEKETAPALEAQKEETSASKLLEAEVQKLLLARDEGETLQKQTKEAILKEIRDAAKKAKDLYDRAKVAVKQANVKRDGFEKIRLQTGLSEAYLRKEEKEKLTAEHEARAAAMKAVEAEATSQMLSNLLREITQENEKRIFALETAETSKTAQAEKETAQRVAKIEDNGVANALLSVKKAERRLSRAQARLLLPITKTEAIIQRREAKAAQEDSIRAQRDADERTYRAAFAKNEVLIAEAKIDRIEAERLLRQTLKLAENAETDAKMQQSFAASGDDAAKTAAQDAKEEADRAYERVMQEAAKVAKAVKIEASLKAENAKAERVMAERLAAEARETAEIAAKNAGVKEELAIVALRSDKRRAEGEAKDAKFDAERKAEAALAAEKRAADTAQKEWQLSANAAGIEDERIALAEKDVEDSKQRAASYAQYSQEKEIRLRELSSVLTAEEVMHIMDEVSAVRARRLSEVSFVDVSVLQEKSAEQADDKAKTASKTKTEKSETEAKRSGKKAEATAGENAEKTIVEKSESRKEEAFLLNLESKIAKEKEHRRKQELEAEAALREQGERLLEEAKEALTDALRNAEQKANSCYHADNNERLSASIAKRRDAAAAAAGAGVLSVKRAKDAHIEADRISRKAHKANLESARAEAEVKARMQKVEEIALDNEDRAARSEADLLLRDLREEIAATEKAAAECKTVSDRVSAICATAKDKLAKAEIRKKNAKDSAERVLADRAASMAKDDFDRADRLAGDKAAEMQRAVAKLATLNARVAYILAKEAERVARQTAAEAQKQVLYHTLVASRMAQNDAANIQAQTKKYQEEADAKIALRNEATSKAAKAAHDLALCEEQEAKVELKETLRFAELAEQDAKKDAEMAIALHDAAEKATKDEKNALQKAFKAQSAKAERTRAIADVENEHVKRAKEEQKRLGNVALHVEAEQLLMAEAENAKSQARADMEARRLSEREVRLLLRMAKLTVQEKQAVLADAELVANLSLTDSKKQRQKDFANSAKSAKERKEIEKTTGSTDAEEYLDLYLQGKRLYPEVNDTLREFTSPINNKVRKFAEKLAETAEEQKRIAEEKENLRKFAAELTAALEKTQAEYRKSERLAEDEILKAQKVENAARILADRAAREQTAAFLRAEEARRNYKNQTDKAEKILAEKMYKAAAAEAERAIRYAEAQSNSIEEAEAETRALVEKAERLKKDHAAAERRYEVEAQEKIAKMEKELSERYAKAVRDEAINAEKKALAAEEAANDALRKQRKAAERMEKDESIEAELRNAEKKHEEARLISKRAAFEAELAEAKAKETAAKVERIAAEDAAREARLAAEVAQKAAVLEALKAKTAQGTEAVEAEKAKKSAEAEAERAEKFARQEEEKAAKALKVEAEIGVRIAELQSKEADRLARLAKKNFEKKKKIEEAETERAKAAEKAEKSEKVKKAKEAKLEAEEAKQNVKDAEEKAQKAREKAENARERSEKIEEYRRQRAAEELTRSREKAQKDAEKEAEKLKIEIERAKVKAEKAAKLKAERSKLSRSIFIAEGDGAAQPTETSETSKVKNVEDYLYEYVEQDQKAKEIQKTLEAEKENAAKDYKEAEEKARLARQEANAAAAVVKRQSETALDVILISRNATEKAQNRSSKGNVNKALLKEKRAEKAASYLEEVKNTARIRELAALKAEAVAILRKERLQHLEELARLRVMREEDAQKQRLALAEAKQAEAMSRAIRSDADRLEEQAKFAEQNRSIAETRLKIGVPGMDNTALVAALKAAEAVAAETKKAYEDFLPALEKAEAVIQSKQAKADYLAAIITAKEVRLAAQNAKTAQMSADLKAQALSGDEREAAEKSLTILTLEADRADKLALDAENAALKAMVKDAELTERAARAERMEAAGNYRTISAEAADARMIADVALSIVSETVGKENRAEAQQKADFTANEAAIKEESAKRASEILARTTEAEKEAAKNVVAVEKEAVRFFENERNGSLEKAKTEAKKIAQKEALFAGAAVKLTPEERQEYFAFISDENRRINDLEKNHETRIKRKEENGKNKVALNENFTNIEKSEERRKEAYRKLESIKQERKEAERTLKKAKNLASAADKRACNEEQYLSTVTEETDREEAQRKAQFARMEADRLQQYVTDTLNNISALSSAIAEAEKELESATAASKAAWEIGEFESARNDYDLSSWNSADKQSLSDLATGNAGTDKTDDAEQFLLAYTAKDALSQNGKFAKAKSPKAKFRPSADAIMPKAKTDTLAALTAMASGNMTKTVAAETAREDARFQRVIGQIQTEIEFLEICLKQQSAKLRKEKNQNKIHTAAELADLAREICEKYFDILGYGKEQLKEREVTQFVPKAVNAIQRYNHIAKDLGKLDRQHHTLASTKIPSAILDGTATREGLAATYRTEDSEIEKQKNLSAHAFHTDMSLLQARFNFRIANLTNRAKRDRYNFTQDGLKHRLTQIKSKKAKKQIRAEREKALRAEFFDNSRYEQVLNNEPFATPFKKKNVDRARLEKLREMLKSALAQRDDVNRKLLELYAGAPAEIEDVNMLREDGRVKSGKNVRSYADAKYAEALTKARKRLYRRELPKAERIQKLYVASKTKTNLYNLLNRKMELTAIAETAEKKIYLYGWKGSARRQAGREARAARRELRTRIKPELRARMKAAIRENQTRPGIRFYH